MFYEVSLDVSALKRNIEDHGSVAWQSRFAMCGGLRSGYLQQESIGHYKKKQEG